MMIATILEELPSAQTCVELRPLNAKETQYK